MNLDRKADDSRCGLGLGFIWEGILQRGQPDPGPGPWAGWGGGLPWGRSVLWVTVYMLFSLTDVEFQGRPQRPEFITESECGKESPPRGKRVEKAVSLKGVPRELTPPRKRWLEYRLWTWSENLADFKIETEFYLTHTPS